MPTFKVKGDRISLLNNLVYFFYYDRNFNKNV